MTPRAQRRSADFQSAVSQVSNLPPLNFVSTPCRLEVGDTAGWKPALQSLMRHAPAERHKILGLGPLRLIAFLLCVCLPLSAQVPKEFRSTDFGLPFFHKGTNGVALQATYTWSSATHLSDEEILVRELEIKTFCNGATKEPQLIAHAPECRVHVNSKIACSDSPLQVFTPNTNFFIEGIGFLCSHKDSLIMISNQVATRVVKELIKAPLLNSQTNSGSAIQTNQFLKIFADQFRLYYESNFFVYSGNVRVVDPQMQLESKRLTGKFTTNSTIEWILAEEDVVVTTPSKGRATGDRALYTARPEVTLELTGHAVWKDGDCEGAAGKFTFNPSAKVLKAENTTHFLLPNQSLGRPTLPGIAQIAPTANAPGTNRITELFADSVIVNLPPDNGTVKNVQAVLAEGNVIITNRFDRTRATAGKALYRQTNDLFELSGQPVWQNDQAEVRGQTLSARQSSRAFSAHGDAQLRLKLKGDLAGSSGLKPSSTTSDNQILQINCSEMDVEKNVATFRDKVHAELFQNNQSLGALKHCDLLTVVTNSEAQKLTATGHVLAETEFGRAKARRSLVCDNLTILRSPQTGLIKKADAEGNVVVHQNGPGKETGMLSAAILNAFFAATTNRLEKIVARQNVFCEQVQPTGATNQVSGGQIVYTFGTNDVVRVTEQPRAILWVPKQSAKIASANAPATSASTNASPSTNVPPASSKSPGTDLLGKVEQPDRVFVTGADEIYYEPKSGKSGCLGEYKVIPIDVKSSLSSPK